MESSNKILRPATCDLRPSSKGFTLIELLIVLAISALFSALAITYSSVGRNEVALSIDTQKISQFIQQARALSLSTYTSDSSSCGYGVSLNPASDTYSIFAYSPVAVGTPCPSIDTITNLTSTYEQEYTDGSWNVPLSQGVVMDDSQSDSLAAIMFYPPDPTAFMVDKEGNFSSGSAITHIYLTTIDGKNSSTITVDPDGQVSF